MAISDQLDALSPRDRKLLLGLFSFAAFLFVGFAAISLNSRLNERSATLQLQIDKHNTLQVLASDYQGLQEVIGQAEKDLAKFDGKPVTTFLEKIARDIGIQAEHTVTKQNKEVVGDVENTSYKIVLRRVSHEHFLTYLLKVERSGFPLNLTSLNIRSIKVKNEVMLRVTFEATHFSFLETK